MVIAFVERNQLIQYCINSTEKLWAQQSHAFLLVCVSFQIIQIVYATVLGWINLCVRKELLSRINQTYHRRYFEFYKNITTIYILHKSEIIYKS